MHASRVASFGWTVPTQSSPVLLPAHHSPEILPFRRFLLAKVWVVAQVAMVADPAGNGGGRGDGGGGGAGEGGGAGNGGGRSEGGGAGEGGGRGEGGGELNSEGSGAKVVALSAEPSMLVLEGAELEQPCRTSPMRQRYFFVLGCRPNTHSAQP